ncbi:MAG: hypothetical protein RLZZ333_885 [Bacteroidota bacterium]|jgi:hypothetical protein
MSALNGPTPFRYSIGLDNMDVLEAIFLFSKLNQYPFDSFEINLQDEQYYLDPEGVCRAEPI